MMVSEYATGTRKQCGRCGASFVVGDGNLAQAGGAPPGVQPQPEQPPQPFAAHTPSDRDPKAGPGSPTHCARCGKKFRGDWDRYSSTKGQVCHICANLADYQTSENEGAVPVPLMPPETSASIPQTAERTAVTKRTLLDRFDDFKQTQTFRTGLWASALGVIGLALYFTMIAPPDTPEGYGDPGRHDAGHVALLGDADNLTAQQSRTLAAITFLIFYLLQYAAYSLALFITLKTEEGFDWSFVRVCGMALLVALVVGLIQFAIGAFLPFMGYIIGWAVCIYLLFVLLDMGFSQIVTFFVLVHLLGILTRNLAMLIVGALGTVLF